MSKVALQFRANKSTSPKLIFNCSRQKIISVWNIYKERNGKLSTNPNAVAFQFAKFASSYVENQIEIHDSTQVFGDEKQISILPRRICEFVYKKDSIVEWRKIDLIEEAEDYITGFDLNDGDKFKKFLKNKIVGGKILHKEIER
jgi:hypothetical protein